MQDTEGITRQGMKDIAKAAVKKLVKGQVFSLLNIPSPAYLHTYVSQISLLKNDFSYVQHLYKASQITDMKERMKMVLRFALTPNWVNSTLIGFKAPLTPIMGETY